MPSKKQKPLDGVNLPQRALSRWENEGGAKVSGDAGSAMKTLPAHLVAYKRTPIFTNETIPRALLHDHRTKGGAWGLIHVERGKLKYTIEDREFILTPDSPGVVEPEVSHFVTPLGDVSFFIEFYRSVDQEKIT